jgi:hypothetical protein
MTAKAVEAIGAPPEQGFDACVPRAAGAAITIATGLTH